jgi:hypothetical protein
VIAEQQLKGHFAGFYDPFILGLNPHPFSDLGGAGGL